jgi:hypothetical protein
MISSPSADGHGQFRVNHVDPGFAKQYVTDRQCFDGREFFEIIQANFMATGSQVMGFARIEGT